eukprot:gene6641-1186_t
MPQVPTEDTKSRIVELTDKDFYSIVHDPEKRVVVKFYATWCGHCKKLVKDYETLAWSFRHEADLVFTQIEGDHPKHKDLSGRYGVRGYPVVLYFGKQDKNKPKRHMGPRKLENLVEWVNDVAETKRDKTGQLSKDAGRVPELDSLVTQFAALTGDAEKQGTLLISVQDFVASHPELASAAHYAKFMGKVLGDKPEFVYSETKRLNGLMISRTLTPEQADSFRTRLNVLAVFEEAGI